MLELDVLCTLSSPLLLSATASSPLPLLDVGKEREDESQHIFMKCVSVIATGDSVHIFRSRVGGRYQTLMSNSVCLLCCLVWTKAVQRG